MSPATSGVTSCPSTVSSASCSRRPMVMRTTAEENAQLGAIFADKLNEATAPVHVLIPLRGFSILDSPGDRFWDPQADAAFVRALRAGLRPEIPVEELDANINDPAFAERVAGLLLEFVTR